MLSQCKETSMAKFPFGGISIDKPGTATNWDTRTVLTATRFNNPLYTSS